MIKRHTTKDLIAASLKELCLTKAADKITVREISNNCGISATTFYNHFQDKYDLMVWVYAEPIKNIVNQIGNGNYNLRNAIIDVLNYLVNNRGFVINAIKNTSGQMSFINHVSRIHFDVMHKFIKSANSLNEISLRIETLLKIWVFGSVQLLCEWLLTEMPIPLEEFAVLLEAGIPAELKSYLYKNAEV